MFVCIEEQVEKRQQEETEIDLEGRLEEEDSRPDYNRMIMATPVPVVIFPEHVGTEEIQ